MCGPWTRERIAQLLSDNDKAVERAIVAIYHRQTQDEKNESTTKHHNSCGFSAAHARLGTYYAKWILSGKRLDSRHLSKARKIALRYTSQLVDIANARTQA